jgi:hypothetical protein
MLDKFFGVHPHVTRSGLWAKMKPGEKDLYIYLMAESERCCTREMKRTDAQIRDRVGVAGRTLCNARKKLQEFGLVRCQKGEGNKYVYSICNPVTGELYPGDPREPRTCSKRPTKTNGSVSDGYLQPAKELSESTPSPDPVQSRACNERLEQHGLRGVFDS